MPGRELLAGRMATVTCRLAFWIPLLGCTWLALIPELPAGPVFGLSDVVLHGVAFIYLTFALVLMGRVCLVPSVEARTYGISGTVAVKTVVVMLGYGIFLELVQSFIPQRSAELKDLLVDLAGTGVGLLLAALLAGPTARLVRYLTRLLAGLFVR